MKYNGRGPGRFVNFGFLKKKKNSPKSIDEMNREIFLIQNSTGTLIPKFVRLHHRLRQKYRWYYQWHVQPFTKNVHWLMFLFYLVLIPLAFLSFWPRVPQTKAFPIATRLKIVLDGENYNPATGSFSPLSKTVRAGDSVSFDIYATNNNSISDTSNTSQVSLTATDPQANFPSPSVQLAGGKKTGSIVFKTVGTWIIAASPITSLTSPTISPSPSWKGPSPSPSPPPPSPTPLPSVPVYYPILDRAFAAISDGQSSQITVTPGPLADISLSASTSEVTAGSPLTLNTALYDSYSNLVTDYNGVIIFTSSDPKARFENTEHTFTPTHSARFSQSVTLKSPGTQSITARTTDGSVSASINLSVSEIIPTLSPTISPSPIPLESATSNPNETPTGTTKTPQGKTTSGEQPWETLPISHKIAKTLTPISTTVATVGFLPLLVQAFPQGFHAFASLFPALFTAFTIRRRRKPWGVVFNSLSNEPIDLAIVRVFDVTTNRLVDTKVTDQNGRFSFLLSKGKYYIKVAKTGFLFPPKISRLKASQLGTRFGPQSDLYFGEPFVISTDDTNINLNICLDPTIIHYSLGLKLTIWLKNGFDWFLIGLSYFALPLMLIGAVFTSIATTIIPSQFNIYMSGIYVILLLAYLISIRIFAARLGFVFDSISRKPIANAIISIFDKEYNAIREIKTTDIHGHFAILAQQGQYYLTVNASGYEFPARKFKFQKSDKKLGTIYLGETISNKKTSFINVSIPLDKESENG